MYDFMGHKNIISDRAQNSSHVISNNSCYHFVDKVAFFALATLATTKKKRIGKESHYQKKNGKEYKRLDLQ